MSELVLQVQHLSKSFGSHEILRDIDFSVHAGDVTSIIGASGSGKSTLLRCINMLETPSDGHILFHGQDMAVRHTNAAAYRAKVGMVFQSFNLFNNMTVLQNCMVGQIKVLKKKPDEAREMALRYLRQVGMAPYINARPQQLSGGQKQRVAIARTLMKDNDILIFDDSLSAVDTETDAQIRAALKRRSKDTTTIIISHRIVTLSQADLILVMEDGRVTEQGTHDQLIHSGGLYSKIFNIQTALEEEFKEENTGYAAV